MKCKPWVTTDNRRDDMKNKTKNNLAGWAFGAVMIVGMLFLDIIIDAEISNFVSITALVLVVFVVIVVLNWSEKKAHYDSEEDGKDYQ